MELTAEITALLTADPPVVKTVELVYPNGGVVKGTVRKLRRSPLKVVILKDHPAGGESPKHKARFAHVSCMKLYMKDGTVREF